MTQKLSTKVDEKCIAPSSIHGDVEFDIRLISDNEVIYDSTCYGRELHTVLPYAFYSNYLRMLEKGMLGGYFTYLEISPRATKNTKSDA